MNRMVRTLLNCEVIALCAVVSLSAQAPPPHSAPPSAQNPSSAPAVPVASAAPQNSVPPAKAETILVPAGTRLPLVLHNGISTRNAHPGDPLYFETLYPVMVGERIAIPAGSYVSGEITGTRRPGRVKGRGEIMMRLNSMILPNGYVVSFLATPAGADTGGAEEIDNEGKIKSAGNKAGDAKTIGIGTAAGAGIGAAAAGVKGAGIGAGIGAVAGITTVLLTRGPELQLPRGTTVDISLDRPLYLDATRAQFTEPGHASTLPGPPNREPTRP